MQYQTAVKAKKTFGYIGIISLLILYGAILLNDLVKLCMHIYERCIEMRDEYRQKIKQEREDDQNSLEIEIDRDYSHELEMKLEQVHLRLVKSIAASRK